MTNVQAEPTELSADIDQPQDQYEVLKPERLLRIAQTIITDWKKTIDLRVEENRNLREVILSQDEAAAAELVDDSETFVGIRVIDENILRETPIFLKYLESSPRQLVFIPLDQPPDFPVELLETNFTKYVRYDGWQIPFYSTFDGSSLHGWCAVEIIVDETKPTGLAVEYIEHNCLLFRLKSKNLSANEMLLRRYTWSPYELRKFARENGFDQAPVKQILAGSDDNVEKSFKVYKLFYKQPTTLATGEIAEVVYCAWYCEDCGQTLLKQPYIHNSGRLDRLGAPVPAMRFPFVVLKYRLTENTELGRAYGRATLDEYSQEGQTVLMTSYVNACKRASNFYPSLKQDNTTSTTVEAGVKLKPNHIMLRALDVFSMPYPDPVIGQAINLLNGRNLQAAGQTDYAAQNRKDSRKTATEIQAAQEQAVMLSGVSVFTISQFLLETFKYVWEILRDNTLAGHTSFMEHLDPEIRLKLLTTQYILRPAGDIDFIERQEKLKQFLTYWPIFAQTPIAPLFLKKLIGIAMPNEAQELIDGIDKAQAAQAQMTQQQGSPMANALIHILAQIPREEFLALFPPESQQQVGQILDEVLNASGTGAGSQPRPSPQGGAPQQSPVPSNPAPVAG